MPSVCGSVVILVPSSGGAPSLHGGHDGCHWAHVTHKY